MPLRRIRLSVQGHQIQALTASRICSLPFSPLRTSKQRRLLVQLQVTEQFIGRLDERIAELTRPQLPVLEKLDAIPGVDRRLAEVLMAEIGPDMTPFPSDAHLASWAGLCPGNNEGAGKNKSGKTTKGSRWLRQALVQAAWAASHKKYSYF